MKSILMRSPVAVATAWVALYIILTFLPLLVIILHTPLRDRSFWVEFSVALGFIGLAMMSLQFALTARINIIESSYGIDIILQFHRYISLVAFSFVIIHPVILFIYDPETLQLLNFIAAPWRARLAVLSVLALVTLVVTSIWRKQLKIPYEPWRMAHTILAVLAIGFGLGHALGVSTYLGLFWNVVLWSAIAIFALWLLIYIRIVKPWRMTKFPYLVEAVTPERGNVWTMVLRPQGHKGLHF